MAQLRAGRLPSAAIRCDATARGGVGHLVRMVALAEELTGRGITVSFRGAVEVAWAAEQLTAAGFALRPAPADPTAFAQELAHDGTSVLVIDGYHIAARVGAAARAAGLGVLALIDGPFGAEQIADTYVDQNLGAVRPEGLAPDAEFLGGLGYALLRDSVRKRRGRSPSHESGRPRVLVVFGGTDAFGGAPVIAGLLLATGLPVDVVAVAADPQRRAELSALPTGPGQRVEVVGPVADLAGLAVTCDAAVSAAGTSVWELLCLGVPAGLVCVTDNQVVGYAEATRSACLGIGHLDALRCDPDARTAAVATLSALLGDTGVRERLSRGGLALVDGRGRERVADAVERLATRSH